MCFAQSETKNSIDLRKIKLCELTILDLKGEDENLKQIDLIEMNLCSDGFVQDGRFENRIGYISKNYPGIIFQKYINNINISKLRLTEDFKGFLPNGSYVDLSKLTAKEVVENNPNFDTWNSRGCSDYWSLNDDSIYFFVEINKTKEPRYPIDKNYYLQSKIKGIDIVSNCYEILKTVVEPIYVIDGIIVNKSELEKFKPDEIESVMVLKAKSAFVIYGEQGKNGAVIITPKRKE